MNKIMNRGHLKLAYSSSETQKANKLPNPMTQIDAWDQLDLFSQPDTLFFASPETYPLYTLLDLLQSSHVTQIIDLRQIPHFSFGGTTRVRFFEALAKLKINYFSLTAASCAPGEFESRGSDLIQQHLQSGPSMVFSDLEPDCDPDIAIVLNELNEADVKFVRVFASI